MSTVFTILMYNNNVLISKQEVINTIPDYMIPVHCFQKNQFAINFTSDDMIPKYEMFTNHKLDTFYLTEIMRTEGLQTLDE